MSLQAQAKVLRALEEGKVERVGSNKLIAVDVRVLAATNKKLDEEIAKEHFRKDLFHRLNVIPIHAPHYATIVTIFQFLSIHSSMMCAREMVLQRNRFPMKRLMYLCKKIRPGNVVNFVTLSNVLSSFHLEQRLIFSVFLMHLEDQSAKK